MTHTNKTLLDVISGRYHQEWTDHKGTKYITNVVLKGDERDNCFTLVISKTPSDGSAYGCYIMVSDMFLKDENFMGYAMMEAQRLNPPIKQ